MNMLENNNKKNHVYLASNDLINIFMCVQEQNNKYF